MNLCGGPDFILEESADDCLIVPVWDWFGLYLCQACLSRLKKLEHIKSNKEYFEIGTGE